MNAESLLQREYTDTLSTLRKKYSEDLGHDASACVVTFGCQMNAHDSEKIIGILKEAGFVITEDESADFVLYNTCTVRDNADQRVYGRLGVLNSMKKKHPLKRIALCGCMMQEETAVEKIKKSYGFVDLIFGTHNLYKFAELMCRMFDENGPVIEILDKSDSIVEDLPTSRKYAYKSGVNIMYGCDNFCSYCIVPYVRGRERSRSSSDIINEVRSLAAEGVLEVMLLGQNVNSYGKNLDEDIDFPTLLSRVCEVPGIQRVRFMTSHPKDLSDELINVMKDNDKICRHLHLPLQSGSDKILKAMNRRYTKESYIDLALKIRSRIPDIAITTDIIVGFPGETDEDVDDTLDVIEKVGFDNAFTFIYSKRSGTPAAKMEQVDEETVKYNFDRVLKLVQDKAKEAASKYEGMVMDALVEDVNDHDDTLMSGRLSNNTIVHFPGDQSLIGKLVPVRLKECKGFYYLGEAVR